ncbi:peptidoglycan-binding protein [Embleya sp. NPDC050154]|uniref:peptidoglycan-binding protein n=1 Tax=Embleya sp. NPDC050154 TaxID=3363988 RepID=UPI0037B346D1
MAGPTWISGAERLGDGSIGGAMDSPNLPPRCVQHTVEAPAGRGWFLSMASYLISAGVEPQILYDPDSDSLGQFGPLNQSGRALRNAGSVRTNRTGKVCVQWEVCGRAAKPWTAGFDPSAKPNFLRAVAAMRAWGIPDVWPAGVPQAYPGDHDDRDMDTWLHRGGWFGHSQVPGNDHGDPGRIDTSKVPPAGTAAPGGGGSDGGVTREQDSINGLLYGYGAHGDHVTAVGRALVAAGFGAHYTSGPGPDWTDADSLNYRDYQRSLGYSGSDADGLPGEASLIRLLGALPSRETSRPSVSLSNVVAAARVDVPAPTGHLTHKADVLLVERALVAEGLLSASYADGSYGTRTVTAYAAWQRRLGYSGSDADGYPGQTSLSKLGDRQGFKVTS